MAVLAHFQVLQMAEQGPFRFYRAKAHAHGQPVYLGEEPDTLPPLHPHPGLVELKTLATEAGVRWLYSEPNQGTPLGDLWSTGSISENELMHCVMQLADALSHLSAARPALLPETLHPDYVYRDERGTWSLDLAALALAPDIRLSSQSNPVKALGAMLYELAGGDGPGDEGPAAGPSFPPALRLIMMRSRWGGFESLDELQDALRRLVPRGETQLPNLPAREPTPPSPPPEPPRAAKSSRRGRFKVKVSYALLSTGLAASLLLAVSLLGFRSAGVQTTEAHVPSGSNAPASLGPVSPPLRPEPAAISKLPSVVVPEPTWADFLAAEPVYQPSLPPPPPPVVVVKADPTPAPPPPVQPAPTPEPLDPVALLDKAAAGNNPVAVRLFGRSLGTAYMFTNPGAPVISLDAFTQLLGRPQSAEVIGPQQLQLTFAGKTLVSGDFMLLDKRVWLVLKPELLDFLGLRVKSYGGGLLDLEPKF